MLGSGCGTEVGGIDEGGIEDDGGLVVVGFLVVVGLAVVVGLVVVVGFFEVGGLAVDEPCTEVGGLPVEPGLPGGIEDPGLPEDADPDDADATGDRLDNPSSTETDAARMMETTPHLLRPDAPAARPDADSLLRAIRTILVPLGPQVKSGRNDRKRLIAGP
jgi:hypothetical protein